MIHDLSVEFSSGMTPSEWFDHTKVEARFRAIQAKVSFYHPTESQSSVLKSSPTLSDHCELMNCLVSALAIPEFPKKLLKVLEVHWLRRGASSGPDPIPSSISFRAYSTSASSLLSEWNASLLHLGLLLFQKYTEFVNFRPGHGFQ